jgi:anti-sigma B factor antagonist
MASPGHRVATLDVRPEPPTLGAVMAGELDGYRVPSLRATIVEYIDGPSRDVVIDRTDVEFMDSAGIEMLVEIYRRVVQESRGTMGIDGASTCVRRVLEICGLAGTFGVDGLMASWKEPTLIRERRPTYSVCP